jgi:hypothetical protein
MPQMPPISFRLNAHELELLNEYKNDSESINQCAARLLRERLGIPDVDSQSTSLEPLLQVMICETVSELLRVERTNREQALKDAIEPIIKRIDAVEVQLGKPTVKRSYTKRKSVSED